MTPVYYSEKKGIRLILPLHNVWVFPGEMAHVDVETPEEGRLFKLAQQTDRPILILPLEEGLDLTQFDDLEGRMGTLAYVRSTFNNSFGSDQVVLEGSNRARLEKIVSYGPPEGEVTEFLFEDDKWDYDKDMEVRMKMAFKSATEYVQETDRMPMAFFYTMVNTNEPEPLSNDLASIIDFDSDTRLQILNTLDLKRRLTLISIACDQLLEMAELSAAISKEAAKRLADQQKDYFLREQMDVIREELGEGDDDPASLADEYREAINALPVAQEIRDQLLREVDRLAYVSPMSSELNVARSYLDTVLDLPWGVYTEDKTDLDHVQQVLDHDHYGLKEVKERILEYIAVHQLQTLQEGKAKSTTILCLVGPPGVGKTSIARSIARAMGRKFTSMRLGGITDEAEIRGHRKTYVGSMPGRIIAQMTRVQTMNPVFLLDELDKVGSDYRGDPAAALLEVLDPEQNSSFEDSYLEIPFDLSQVMFLATANTTDTIPPALMDRMEIITIPGYTEEEKEEIGRHYLVNKQREANGLTGRQLRINRGVVEEIIRHYTREAGVRELERQIGKVCRVAAKKIVKGEGNISLTVDQVPDFLGPPKYLDEDLSRTPQVGKVNGLAWTEVGGVILTIEASRMEGHGQLLLTGSLGAVMKESAELAISYIRANARRFGLDPAIFQWNDIHIHLPEGAVPKDGPSAGIAILTAVLSVLSQRPVDSSYAMTGELTLTGKVLPIGGVKEKVLAARRYGIPKVILPRENLRDLKDLDPKLAQDLEFIPVDQADEVIALVLQEPVEEKKAILFQAKEDQPLGFLSGRAGAGAGAGDPNHRAAQTGAGQTGAADPEDPDRGSAPEDPEDLPFLPPAKQPPSRGRRI